MIGPGVVIVTICALLTTELIPVRVEEIVEEVGCLRDWGPPGGGAQEGVLIISIATVRSPITQILGDNQENEIIRYFISNLTWIEIHFSSFRHLKGSKGGQEESKI